RWPGPKIWSEGLRLGRLSAGVGGVLLLQVLVGGDLDLHPAVLAATVIGRVVGHRHVVGVSAAGHAGAGHPLGLEEGDHRVGAPEPAPTPAPTAAPTAAPLPPPRIAPMPAPSRAPPPAPAAAPV